MKVKIIDKNKCEYCKNRTCAFVDAVIKESFYSLRSETTVCPIGTLIDSTIDSTDSRGNISKCICCGLCVAYCQQKNLTVIDYDDSTNAYDGLSDIPYNAIAMSTLNKIVGFAANTNRNHSMNFDGYAQTSRGESFFVEVDYGNDSLESCRRLIADFITYEENNQEIKEGLIVLKDIPKEGSRDIHNVLTHIKSFPTTQKYTIYLATFSLLRSMMLYMNTEEVPISELFYNPLEMSWEDYLIKIQKYYSITSSEIQTLRK